VKKPVRQEEGKDWDGGGGGEEKYIVAMVKNTDSIP
jgi:hypothetical protein